MAAAGGPDDTLRVWVYTQDARGSRGHSYTTPIDDQTAGSKKEEDSTKAELQAMINDVSREACQNNVAESYIRTTATRINTILMVVYKVNMVDTPLRASRSAARSAPAPREVKEPLGFICAKNERDEDDTRDGLYIDVICTKKSVGAKLLNYFVEYAKKAGKTFIGLSSLPSVIAYYPKMKFQYRKTCAGEPLVHLSEEMTEHLADLKARGVSPPVTSAEAYDSKPYMNFMLELHSKGLTVRKEGRCGEAGIKRSAFKKDQCGADGFSMKRCELGGGGRSRRCCRAGGRRRRHTRKRA